MEQLRFDHRVALITGAGNGLGRAHALLLASRGARVVVNDIGGDVAGGGSSMRVAHRVVEEIRAAGGEAIADTHSVADEASARAMVDTALDTWGRLDVVVNNAGVLDTAELVAGSQARDEVVLGTHLQGTINVTRAAWPVLVDRAYGRVVMTSSGAIFGSPAGLAYQAAKGGVFSFSRGMATAGRAAGITVNAILPTAFTRMTDSIPDAGFRSFMERRFTPDRIAAFVAVLAHESCATSGEAFLVGGGRVARLLLAVTHGVISEEPTPEQLHDQLAQILNRDELGFPADRLEEFQSYLGRLGYGDAELDMGGLVRGAQSR